MAFPLRLPSLSGPMADGGGYSPNPAMGIDLRAGHIHKDRYGRSPAPAASHRPAGKKRMQHASSDRSPKRTEAPELPRLRALEAQAAAIPISSSAPSSTSPRSGSSRVNPYPVGEATESSPFEIVPSVAPSYPLLGTRRIIGGYPDQRRDKSYHSLKRTHTGYEPKPGTGIGIRFDPG